MLNVEMVINFNKGFMVIIIFGLAKTVVILPYYVENLTFKFSHLSLSNSAYYFIPAIL